MHVQTVQQRSWQCNALQVARSDIGAERELTAKHYSVSAQLGREILRNPIEEAVIEGGRGMTAYRDQGRIIGC